MSPIPSTEGVPSTSQQQTLLAFVYEAADIHPGMTIDEYRSERAGNHHRRGLHAWLRRLGSRGQVCPTARSKGPALIGASPAQNDEGKPR